MTTVLLSVYVGWVAFLGAAIGSFLNVVIWRVPEKMSLISPPSHCPKCGAKIRWFDNVPVFGWLALGGRCRDCKAPISPRYPAVEFLCGSISALFAAAILFGGWIGFSSQPLFWNDWANRARCEALWSAALEREANGSDAVPTDAATNLALSATDFSGDAFLRTVNSATALSLIWAFAAFAALVLGFVEWDKGRSPKSLVWSAAAVPIVGLSALGATSGAFGFGAESDLLRRVGVWGASVSLGVAGTFLLRRAIPKDELFEFAVLGAIWGFCAGWIAALPGALILAGAALLFRRWKKRSFLGLLIFGAIYLGAIAEALWFATRPDVGF